MEIAYELHKILRLIEPSMIVGGFVRDSILNVESNDIDIVTLLKPNKVTQILEGEGMKIIPTGIEHGTVTAIYNEKKFEITTARKDISTDGRHAKVIFSDNFAEDAERRDFTFNALYMDENGEITDFTGGKEDLANGIVKFIGDPKKRINEDYLRILRFFRFYGRYSKHQVDKSLLEILKEYSPLLKQLSAERISEEIWKILCMDSTLKTLEAMQEAGVLDVLGLKGNIQEASLLPANPLLRLYCLGGENISKNIHFVFSNKQKQYFKTFARSENIPFCDENLAEKSYFIGKEMCLDVLKYLAIKTGDYKYNNWIETVNNNDSHEFPISGDDLMKLGYPEGCGIGVMLKKAENWWAGNGFPHKDSVLKYIMEL